MRTVEIDAIADNWNDIVRATDGKCLEAIGYISTWAIASPKLNHVHITVTSADMELSAYFSDGKQQPGGFLLVAVWHASEKRYSFHS